MTFATLGGGLGVDPLVLLPSLPFLLNASDELCICRLLEEEKEFIFIYKPNVKKTVTVKEMMDKSSSRRWGSPNVGALAVGTLRSEGHGLTFTARERACWVVFSGPCEGKTRCHSPPRPRRSGRSPFTRARRYCSARSIESGCLLARNGPSGAGGARAMGACRSGPGRFTDDHPPMQ